MNKETQEYYESLIELFSLDGWKYFKNDLEESLVTLKNSAHVDCDTNEKWHKRRGEISKLEQIVSYEDFIRASLEQIENDGANH